MTPIEQFVAWHADAMATETADANAMALATTTLDGRPSVRMVLYRGVSGGGLRFFTNQQSRKGDELALNPRCAAVFHWPVRARQIRVEGVAVRLDAAENDAYFAARPHGHQVAATISAQSRPVVRAALESAFAQASTRYEGVPVPRPAHWGGYRIVPDAVEFWQHVDNRLHQRHRYELRGERWEPFELAP